MRCKLIGLLETEDIIGTFQRLHCRNVLGSIQFVAFGLNRLPMNGPGELNICSIGNRRNDIKTDDKILSLAVVKLRRSLISTPN